MNGYTEKILRIDLTRESVSSIETAQYREWVGGHGMGSAIFWDLVEDKTIDGFDPRNVITVMTSPLTGTLSPGGAARVEVQGIGVQSSPIGWFTRSNLGGRFGAMLKYAGWDGIVIEGKAKRPVWVDIRNADVRIRDATGLWGLDTWETQKRIWRRVSGKEHASGRSMWDAEGGRLWSSQRPAVLAIGPAGERLSRIAAIIHDAGNAAGQGGFGGVWGAKNLKAVSVIGTSSIHVSRPQELIDAMTWLRDNYLLDAGDPDKLTEKRSVMQMAGMRNPSTVGTPPALIAFWSKRKRSRPQACVGCPAGCRARNDTGLGNESGCAETTFYSYADLRLHGKLWVRVVARVLEALFSAELGFMFALLRDTNTDVPYRATDMLQRLGINAFELYSGTWYLRDLHKKGVLGPSGPIDCDLPFDKFGELEFADKLLNAIAFRRGIGDDLAEGFYRAAKKWGRLDKDLKTGLLPYAYWGLPDHFDPRFQLEWGYGSVLGDRDINEHGFNTLFWMPSMAKLRGKDPLLPAEKLAEMYADRMVPYQGDRAMLDYGNDNMYSEHMAKLVSWHRHYARFWKQSVSYCDFLFPDFFNPARDDNRGMLGEGEPRFLNAVTGGNLSFADGMSLGRKIWNLDNAIWTLQGRHRDMVRFSEYIHSQPLQPYAHMPGTEDGEWTYINAHGRTIEKDKFEGWKSKFYELEGWDPETGWPTRATLESMGMGKVADELQGKGKLGGSQKRAARVPNMPRAKGLKNLSQGAAPPQPETPSSARESCRQEASSSARAASQVANASQPSRPSRPARPSRLLKPSQALAHMVLSEVGFDHRLVGYRLRRRLGPQAVPLYSFADVVAFLSQDLAYLDLGVLERWVKSAFGDAELADTIRTTDENQALDPDKRVQVRDLMALRLAQCKKVT